MRANLCVNHSLWSRPLSDVLQQGFSKQNTISNKEGVASMAGRCGEESVGDEG